MLAAIFGSLLLLFFGDFLSTFVYHIPEHIFGNLHFKTHHHGKKNFRHYAILTFDPLVLLDGILGALPYLLLAVILWDFSPIGVICGLLLGQFHVWWRHITILGATTPKIVTVLCQIFFITTPERHWIHHQKPNQAFGDIFTFFDEPAKVWLRWLRWLRLYFRQSAIVNKY